MKHKILAGILVFGFSVFCMPFCIKASAISVGDVYGSHACPTPAGPTTAGTLKVDAVYQDATCTSAGSFHVQCTGCNYNATISTPALGHVRAEAVTAEPTCTANGSRTVACSRCSTTLESTPVPATGHELYQTITVPPTCTKNGIEVSACLYCAYAESGPVPALGHDFHTSVNPEPTCTETGLETTKCSRCAETRTNGVAALGHDLQTVITKAATCTEEGEQITSCTRCTHKTTLSIAALGHAYEVTVHEATCEEAGAKVSLCSRCGDEEEEVIDPPGHNFSVYETVTEPSCEEDGLRKATCDRCGEHLEEVIPHTGHSYPDEWTIEQQAGYFNEGLESRTCPACLTRLEQTIPKKSKLPVAAAACGVLLLGGGASGFLWKRKRILPESVDLADVSTQTAGQEQQRKAGIPGVPVAVAASAGAGAAKALKGLQKPSVETKTLVVCSENAALLQLFRSKRFLKDTDCTPENLVETVKAKEPDLVICSITSKERLEEVVAAKQGELNDYAFAFVVDPDVLETEQAELDRLVNEKTVSNYISSAYNENTVLVKLVAPLLKPDPKTDDMLEGIGVVADMLGIPGISTVIEVFSSGKEIKETVQKSKLALSDQTCIISDLAGILGFDAAADVLELISDVSNLKGNTKKTDLS